jgi:hypothetical protein
MLKAPVAPWSCTAPTAGVYNRILFQSNGATYRLTTCLLVKGTLELDASTLGNGVTLLPTFAAASLGTQQHFQVAERGGNLTALNVRFRDARYVVR